MFKKTPLAYAISCAVAVSSLGISQFAIAQDQDAPEEFDEGVVEEVIVTGSRIKRDSFSSSTPIDMVLTEAATVQGLSDVGGLLQSTTIAAGSSQVTAATSTAFVQNGGTGAQTLSLRGLGANRTLTLLNGRRVGPAGVRGGVSAFDLNVIPLAAIERIEILKDGASSIYGSDAVAGVVNIITKKGDGGTVEAFVGVPAESGGMESRLSASWGASSDRGNFRVTLDYHKSDEMTIGDRKYLTCDEQYTFDPETGARADVIDPRTGKPSCRDRSYNLWTYDYQYYYNPDSSNVPADFFLTQYDYDGDLGQYIPGFGEADPDNPYHMVTPPGWFPVAYDRASDGVTNQNHPFKAESSFYPENEKTTLFADGELNLTDTTRLYGEILLNRRTTKVNSWRQIWSYVFNENFSPWWAGGGLGTGNPLNAGWAGANYHSPTAMTDHFDSEVEIDYQRYVLGATGEFSKSWFWDLSYQYSNSKGSYQQDQTYDDSIWATALLNGSCVGTVTAVRGVPCVDIPWLDPYFIDGSSVSQEVRDFIFGEDTGITDYTQWSVEGFVSGDLFDLPAGTVAGAFGFHYREDKILDTPGDITLAGNGWGISSAGITQGKDTTQALFAELDIPLITDKPGFQALTLNVSGRYTDVDSYGDDTTYKVGLNWQITNSWRFRASQGTSFRTPALFELYLADQTSFVSQRSLDPCRLWGAALEEGKISQRVADNCAATVDTPVFGDPLYPNGLPPDYTGGTVTGTMITGGGLGVLEAETSKSNTFGLIWTPGFANLSVSVDYFDIEVNDQVDQLGGTTIVGRCYSSEFWPNDPLCNLFDRSGLNAGIENIRDSFINIATQTNKGWDIALQWITEAWGGTFTLDTQHTRYGQR